MANHNVKTVNDCALLIANELQSGLTVYLTESGSWDRNPSAAWHLTSDANAEKALRIAQAAESSNVIVGPYLIDASPDGTPTHIRERLRVDGPSINYLQNQP